MSTNESLSYPVSEPHTITSNYGYRILNGKKQFHDGIDWISSTDRNVLSFADGQVTYDQDWYEESKRWTDKRHSGGNMVIIKHQILGKTYFIRYLHLKFNTVSQGQIIKRGQVIGEWADVGYSFGAHLHTDAYDSGWNKIDIQALLKLAGLEV